METSRLLRCSCPFAAHIREKVNVLVASKSENVHAGNLIKVLAPIVSGRGGGKPDMAMAGGSDANSIKIFSQQ